MTEPKDMVLPVHREIQTELAAFRREATDRFSKLEVGQRNIRSALAGETVLSRMLVGEYEERIEALEKKIRILEESR